MPNTEDRLAVLFKNDRHDKAKQVFRKIVMHLRQEGRPPMSLFDLTLWLNEHLDGNDIQKLRWFHGDVGSQTANRAMVRACVESGKYIAIDPDSIELKPGILSI